MIAGSRLRSRVLMWASQITGDQADVVAVAANAAPLLEWLEAADDADDMDARESALSRLYCNRNAASSAPDDDPAEFIRHATVLYAFITGGNLPGGEPS